MFGLNESHLIAVFVVQLKQNGQVPSVICTDNQVIVDEIKKKKGETRKLLKLLINLVVNTKTW